MKALKLAVAALAVIVVVLLFTIRRLSNRIEEQSQPKEAASVTEVTPPSSPNAEAVSLPPAPAPAPAQAAERPSPLLAQKPVTKPRRVAQVSTPPAAPEEKPASPATSPVTPPPASPAPEPPRVEAAKEPPPPPPPRRVTIPAGTTLVVRTQNTLSTERNLRGDTFQATLEEPLVVDGFVLAERGAVVEGHVVRAEKAGRVEGVSSLAVELVRLQTSDGQRLNIATNLHEVQGERSRGKDAAKVGIASGIGAAIGAIAGGGKGAAIGAGVGAGAGAGTVAATRGKDAIIPSEERLAFRLRTPIEVTEKK